MPVATEALEAKPLIREGDLHIAAALIKQRKELMRAREVLGCFEPSARFFETWSWRDQAPPGLSAPHENEMRAAMKAAALDYLDRKIAKLIAQIADHGVQLEDPPAEAPAGARTSTAPDRSERLELQNAEFEAMRELRIAFDRLPPVVDDDYPEMRACYESCLRAFLRAVKVNRGAAYFDSL